MLNHFEHRKEPLLPRALYFMRLARHAAMASVLIIASLGIGILGYHGFEGLGWLDAAVNAAMLLGGMGPVNELHTVAGKLFAIFYALFSGIVFLVLAGIILAPPLHRLLHRFHVESEDEK